MSQFQTDSLRPSALPSASVGRGRQQLGASRAVDFSTAASGSGGSGAEGSGSGAGGTAGQAGARFHDEWNIRVDQQVKAVSNGLKELVELADIGTEPRGQVHPLPALHLKLRTSQLIRATQTLRDTAHELKLMLLLSDEMDIARRRDEEVRAVKREVKRARQDVARGFVRLVAREDSAVASNTEESGPGRGGLAPEGDGGQDEATLGDAGMANEPRTSRTHVQDEPSEGVQPVEETEPRDIPLPSSVSPDGPQRPADGDQPGTMSPSQAQAQPGGMDVDGAGVSDGDGDDDDDMEEV